MSTRTNPAAHAAAQTLVWVLGVLVATYVLAENTTTGGLLNALGVLVIAAFGLVALDLRVGDRDRQPAVRGVNW